MKILIYFRGAPWDYFATPSLINSLPPHFNYETDFLQIVSNSTAEVDNEAVTSPQWEGYIHEVHKYKKL